MGKGHLSHSHALGLAHLHLCHHNQLHSAVQSRPRDHSSNSQGLGKLSSTHVLWLSGFTHAFAIMARFTVLIMQAFGAVLQRATSTERQGYFILSRDPWLPSPFCNRWPGQEGGRPYFCTCTSGELSSPLLTPSGPCHLYPLHQDQLHWAARAGYTLHSGERGSQLSIILKPMRSKNSSRKHLDIYCQASAKTRNIHMVSSGNKNHGE